MTSQGESSNPKKIKRNEDFSDWLRSLEDYVQETQADVLDLEGRGLGKEEVQSILNFLPDSKVTELNLKSNCLANGMKDLAPLLIKTKIRKLSVSVCGLRNEDLLRLFEILKDSQIMNLDALGNTKLRFRVDEAQKCVSDLQKSKLTTLLSDCFNYFPPPTMTSLLQEYLSSSITCLDLKFESYRLNLNDLFFLFTNLGRSSITDLTLYGIKLSLEASQILSQRLAERKLTKLNFVRTHIIEDHLTILVEGLVNSSIVDFSLQGNYFVSLSPLFTKLQETQIKTLNLQDTHMIGMSTINDGIGFIRFDAEGSNRGLILGPRTEPDLAPLDSLRGSSVTSLNLSSCSLNDLAGEKLMESLRFSNVTKLDMSRNAFGTPTVRKFCEHIGDINVVDLDISCNPLSPDAFLLLGESLKKSRLTRISVNGIESLRTAHLFSFLQLTEGSSVNEIEMNEYFPVAERPSVFESEMLKNAKFTQLHLHSNCICDDFPNLVTQLKFSSIVHLNLTDNGIADDGVEILAKCLKETSIRRLNLRLNLITSQGAKALALSFKDTNLLYLNLGANKINDDGLEFLADHAKDTFITELDVSINPGKRVLLLDKVMWQNKVLVHRVVNFFKQISPRTNDNEFRFDQNLAVENISTFLDNCLSFYKSIVGKSGAISVLLEEESVPFSREQIRLLFEEFPSQFSSFIACRIEASLLEHVRILEKAEEMELSTIVESLLLNRPLYLLDEEQGILHPYVYRLMLKYKQPICNLDVEPHGVIKIIEYFSERGDIEGAQDLVNLLRGANIS